MIEFSDVTGKKYEAEDCVFYRNPRQIGFLLSKPDCVVVDVFADSRENIVLVFPRWLHKKYLYEWNTRPHDTGDKK